MNIIRKTLFLLASSLLLVMGVGLSTYAAEGSIVVTPASYDFGDILPANGPVTTTVTVKNTGSAAIKINRISTSCGCTTAEMDDSDLRPGEERKMDITFDPNVHPDQSGTITRVVYLQTSEEVTPEIEIDIVGNVVREGGSNSSVPKVKPSLTNGDVTVFFNEACQDCGELVNEFYPGFFEGYDLSLERKDYINERANRKLLNEYNDKWGVPFELQSHIEAFVGDKLLIGGHVPEKIMRYLIENPDKYEKLLVYQDKMHGEGEDYKVWDFEDDIMTYAIDEPITNYFNHTESSGDSPLLAKGFWGLFGIVTTSAFLDGINPCAVAVLLFFIAFLFSIKRTKAGIWKMGLVYIAAIYFAYLLIGLGIAQAIIISGAPHLMAIVGAYLVIILGVIQLIGIVSPKFPIKLRIPISTKAVLEKWLYKSTIPAAFIGGFIVGLCTFPCSGGIYVAIIGMLASSQTQLSGFMWMLWYNLVFVAPLIIILLLSSSEKATEQLQQLERRESKKSKVIIGLTMIALGLIIIFFFT